MYNSSGYTRHIFAGVNRHKLMELVNSNTLLILNLQLSKAATVSTEQFNSVCVAMVPGVSMSSQTSGQSVDLLIYIILAAHMGLQLPSNHTSLAILPVLSARVGVQRWWFCCR